MSKTSRADALPCNIVHLETQPAFAKQKFIIAFALKVMELLDLFPVPDSHKNCHECLLRSVVSPIFNLMVDNIRLSFGLLLWQSEDIELLPSSSCHLGKRFQPNTPVIASPSQQVGRINFYE